MRRVLGAFCLAAIFGANTAYAEGLILSGSNKSRSSVFKSQTKFLDSRAARQYSASVRLQPKSESIGADLLPRFSGNYRGAYLEVARSAARKHAVPEDLFLRLVQQESRWNVHAKSHKGATGLAQLMPDTARLMGVDIDNPHQNLDGGARYLRMMYDKFGTWRLALAAYNAGPAAVEKHTGIPPFSETQNYVRVILGS
ncbi:MAG: lytic transglycosylase domain-containing protein [Paracoccaceae bacterium]|nr:lytic transglycosylase domain-containing protein [Paracoccaceae bacterium]